MEAGLVLFTVGGVVLGAVIGLLIGRTLTNRRYLRDTKYTQGTLNVDSYERGTAPELFLGLAVPVEDVVSRKYIILNVNVLSSNSRK